MPSDLHDNIETAPVAARVEPAPEPLPQPPANRGFGAIPVIGVWAQPAAWGGLLYFCGLGLALAIAYFIWAATLGTLAIGTAPTLVGVPILVLLLASTRGISLFQGKLIGSLLRVPMPQRTQPIAGTTGVGFWQRIVCWLRDGRSWLSLGYLFGNLPLSILIFTIMITALVLSMAFLALPLHWVLGIPLAFHAPDNGFEYWFFGLQIMPDAAGNVWLPGAAAVPSLLLGILLMTGTLWLSRGFGSIYGRIVQGIQVASPQQRTE
ncbi:MAG: hypothetical protein GC172_02740 [Phycisphaera sp.]|nr:hypothetical protein [Phycisphaera sp.]